MLFFYLNNINFLELIFQVIIIYNIYQILNQSNFYYIISYFFLLIIYFGIFLILYDLDLNCIILWIIYGGICIIFFIYSLMWFEVFKSFYKNITFQKKNYFIIILIIITILNYRYTDINYFFQNKFYLNYYEINELDKIQELEILGWGILYYTTILFILFSYFLLFNCIIVTILNNNNKKIKNNLLNYYYYYFLKNQNLYFLSFIKNQHFFNQEYENNYQNYSLLKNYKITNYFHQVKNIQRRI